MRKMDLLLFDKLSGSECGAFRERGSCETPGDPYIIAGVTALFASTTYYDELMRYMVG